MKAKELVVILGVTLAVAGGACRAVAGEFEVKLQVKESAGVARKAEPISGGVPLPRGRFKKGQAFALSGPGGREVPCQVTPLVVDPDGTLRWILLDFQDEVAANGVVKYSLKAVESKAKPRVSVKVEESAEVVTVDTGAIRFAVDKKAPFGFFKNVEVGGQAVVTGGVLSYEQLHGRSGWDDGAKWQSRKLLAGVPKSVKVWYAGPMRVTIEVTGSFADDPLKAGYKAWITAWAGKSRVFVKHKLCNSNPGRFCAIPVKRWSVELNLAGKPSGAVLGAKEPLPAGLEEGSAWLHQGLRPFDSYQDVPGAARAGHGKKVLWTGDGRKGRPQGWLAVKGAQTLFAWDQTFSFGAPRRLALEGNKLILDGLAGRFEEAPNKKWPHGRRIGSPYKSEHLWLFDCTHRSSEYFLDFAAPSEVAALGKLARACHNRLWVRASSEHYSETEAVGSGRFGSLEDEKACYRKWGWAFTDRQLPSAARLDQQLLRSGYVPLTPPGAFKDYEDNHWDSESDTTEAMLLMYLRTGDRKWFDIGETWARYHADLQAWRTDGWKWKDAGVWFTKGCRPQRDKAWNFKWKIPYGKTKAGKDGDCLELHSRNSCKACYCHYYGGGLVDYYCLTGDRDALEAAVDDVEQKNDEFRRHGPAGAMAPGKSTIGNIRGFGRGFQVLMRVLEADPGNKFVADLAELCARTLWRSPLLDERGFHCSKIGAGHGGMKAKSITPKMKKWMTENGITAVVKGDTVDSLKKGEKTWKVRCLGGTWMHVYVQNGADLHARHFGDEDMQDFTVAFAQFSARYMLSPKCHQTWYYTYMDVPDLGRICDPWEFEHTDTTDGEGCKHSGHYTRFYPDACAKGYSWTGERHFLERGKLFWHYGSKRLRAKTFGDLNKVGRFAGHVPPKSDSVLANGRLFYEWSHPRKDAAPPKPITDLAVTVAGGKATVSFTAPADQGGGRVARYQVKCSELPILAYEKWDYVRDSGKKRNWWRAANLSGEPKPQPPGAKESFTVTGVPANTRYFAVRSFDDSQNRSAIGNLAEARK